MSYHHHLQHHHDHYLIHQQDHHFHHHYSPEKQYKYSSVIELFITLKTDRLLLWPSPWLLLKVLIVDWLVKQIDFQNTNPIEGNQTIRIIGVNRQSARIFERWILLLSIAGHWLFYFNAHHQHHKHHHHLHNHDDHHQPLGDDPNSILGCVWPDRPWQLWAGWH